MKKFRYSLFLILLLISSIFVTACDEAKIPYIGENGNWWVGEEDTGVCAQGPKGEKGDAGNAGEKGDKGETGESGNAGSSVTLISMEKIKSEGLVDTYKLTFSDGAFTEFTVTNGKEGNDGASVLVASFEKVKSEGLSDTYKITFTDGTFAEFTVTNGESGTDGNTPYIGLNGNWWIDDEDTGIKADFNPDKRAVSEGFSFELKSVGGNAGIVISGYSGTDKNVVIPNYIGTIPVIGINAGVFAENTDITCVSLSKNTLNLPDYAFSGCSSLTSIDFNGCNLERIPKYAIKGTSISSIKLPDTVKELTPFCFADATKLESVDFGATEIQKIPDYAFDGTALSIVNLPQSVTELGKCSFRNAPVESINYENIIHFGEECLNKYLGGYVYLSDNVETVGKNAFLSSYVYTKHEETPPAWHEHLAGTDRQNSTVITKCHKNENYIYNKNTIVTVLRYVGNEKKITIPALIDNLPVRKIGYGFASLSSVCKKTLLALGKDSTLISEVKIPSSVQSIEYATFLSEGTMIFVPSSVAKMWAGEKEVCSSFYAFESTTPPVIKTGFLNSSSDVADWLSEYGDYIRVAFGIDCDKVYYEENTKSYYIEDGGNYSLLALMDLTSESVEIASTANGKVVTTILPDAVSALSMLKSVTVNSGIKEIKSCAFNCLSLDSVILTSSIEIVEECGFDEVCEKFYIDALYMPSSWNTDWAGVNTDDIDIILSS